MRRFLLVLLGILSIAAGGWWYTGMKQGLKSDKVIQEKKVIKNASEDTKVRSGNEKRVDKTTLAELQGTKNGGGAQEIEYEQLSPEREKKLLELLASLEEASVRNKERIARKLSEFRDPRSVEALERLIEEDERQPFDIEEEWAPKPIAEESLDKMVAVPDIMKLTPNLSMDEQERIIRKYGTRPYSNNYGYYEVKKYLIQQADVNPEQFLPILVELFPGDQETENLAKRYPKLADDGLDICLASRDNYQVRSCMRLVSKLRKKEYLGTIYAIAFEKAGQIDYSKNFDSVRDDAITVYWDFGLIGIEYLKKALYSEYKDEKSSIVSLLANMDNQEAKDVIYEFDRFCQDSKKCTDQILHSLDWALGKIGEKK